MCHSLCHARYFICLVLSVVKIRPGYIRENQKHFQIVSSTIVLGTEPNLNINFIWNILYYKVVNRQFLSYCFMIFSMLYGLYFIQAMPMSNNQLYICYEIFKVLNIITLSNLFLTPCKKFKIFWRRSCGIE